MQQLSSESCAAASHKLSCYAQSLSSYKTDNGEIREIETERNRHTDRQTERKTRSVLAQIHMQLCRWSEPPRIDAAMLAMTLGAWLHTTPDATRADTVG